MRTAVRALRRFLAVVGALTLWPDLRGIWKTIRKHIFPWASVVVIALLGWWEDAPFWQTAAFSVAALVVLYCVVFGLGVLRESGVFDRLAQRRSEHRETHEPEARYRQRAQVVSRLQELLVENERAFRSLAHAAGNDPEKRGKEARESYGSVDRYYRTNKIVLTDRQLCQKIEEYLSMSRDVLVDFFQLNEPNDARRAINLPDDPQERDEMRASVARRVYADLPNLHKEIEEGFREALGQT